ncbi:hypothetical protein AVEN_254825-1 [Araneus ventricosus]|uniref:Transposase Tc1-like domain-containing protein n=1 Tax=Araneus ventricosus TaxID=182803 RepID=A0A4Y2QNP4_ARAVE|nr:hypothetical protein AVEN_14747-1 [Araneus ventricosus]GBN64962.1 hypothetical protein AVEN_254825-1 [Araneus ventricosus]
MPHNIVKISYEYCRASCANRDVSDFKKGRIIGLHHSKKTTKEIAGIGLRSVQRILKTRKDSNEPSTSRNKCGRKKLLSSRNRRSQKRLVKKSQKKWYLRINATEATDLAVFKCRQIWRFLYLRINANLAVFKCRQRHRSYRFGGF